MAAIELQSLKNAYDRNGFVSGVEIVTPEEAAVHRRAMERLER